MTRALVVVLALIAMCFVGLVGCVGGLEYVCYDVWVDWRVYTICGWEELAPQAGSRDDDAAVAGEYKEEGGVFVKTSGEDPQVGQTIRIVKSGGTYLFEIGGVEGKTPSTPSGETQVGAGLPPPA